MNDETLHVYSPEARLPFLRGALAVVRSWLRNRHLLGALTRRDVLVRYKGSALGLVWSFIHPLVLLAVYTVVFTVFLHMKWNEAGDRWGEFTVMMFCGLIPFQVFSEVMSKAGSLVVASPSYVKRIAFPVEVLPWVAVGSAMLHALISFGVLLAAVRLMFGALPWTVLYLPVILVPFILTTVALAMFLAACGVFLRDLNHTVSVAVNILFFLTPIFYSSDRVRPSVQWLLFINPVAYVAANVRKVCVQGLTPVWSSWLLYLGISLVLVLLVAGWFQRVRVRFADVM